VEQTAPAGEGKGAVRFCPGEGQGRCRDPEAGLGRPGTEGWRTAGRRKGMAVWRKGSSSEQNEGKKIEGVRVWGKC
jgi:hypothetical protein